MTSKKHKIWKRLCEIPSLGPIRAAVLLGILQTAHRFRTKRQLWTDVPQISRGKLDRLRRTTVGSTLRCT
jgi:hypothetical protein